MKDDTTKTFEQQSNGGQQSDENNDNNNEELSYQHEEEPFWSFIPKIGSYGMNIVLGELNHLQRGIAGLPSWSVAYGKETISFYKENPNILYKEVISGFTVAIMQVPESIAFSFVAGVPPLSGLQATFWMATITGLLGGKPGMISGAAGALAVVVAKLTQEDGELSHLTPAERLNVLYMTMVWCGVVQILFAWFRLAKLVRLIPETGMIGFMNGLAIIIFLAQLPAFQKCTQQAKVQYNPEVFVDCKLDDREWLNFIDDTWVLIFSLLHVAVCMLIMKFSPSIPVIGKMIPASLVALLFGTAVEHGIFRAVFDVGTRIVKETAGMSGSLPKFDWPQVPTDSKTMNVIIVYSITLAAIGGVESVLTLQACNEITDTVPKISDSNQELFAQGLANFVSGLFRAMGGDAMIGQSTINIMNGARYRISSTMSGIFMLLFIIALSSFIELIPVSTLTGVLFMVVLSTFQWKTFRILRYGRLSDSGAIVLVTLIAVFFNLAVAIATGIIFSALVHAWDSGAHIQADVTQRSMIVNGTEYEQVKYVKIRGTIFFSSARHFINLFSVLDDPSLVIIDLRDALVIDHSAVAAIQGITHRFAQVNKCVLLTNVPTKSCKRLHRTGDHDMLAKQLTPSYHVTDIETSTSSGVGGDGKTTTTTTTTTTANGHHNGSSNGETTTTTTTNTNNNNTTLQNLNMLQCPIESVDDELAKLKQENNGGNTDVRIQ